MQAARLCHPPACSSSAHQHHPPLSAVWPYDFRSQWLPTPSHNSQSHLTNWVTVSLFLVTALKVYGWSGCLHGHMSAFRAQAALATSMGPFWCPAVVGIPIKADAGFSVTRALQLQMQQHLHALEEVSEYASKEFALERALDKMQVSPVQQYNCCGRKYCGMMSDRQQAAPSQSLPWTTFMTVLLKMRTAREHCMMAGRQQAVHSRAYPAHSLAQQNCCCGQQPCGSFQGGCMQQLMPRYGADRTC